MIKKFEEFINETASPSWKNKSHSWRNRVTSLDTEESAMKHVKNILCDMLGFPPAVLNRFGSNSMYTFEEMAEILNRFGINSDTSSYAGRALKVLLDVGSSTVKDKQEALDEYNEKTNGGVPIPVIVDINGKMITGKVYYCEALDAYAKDEDDFNEDGYEWLAKEANEEGILDDDQPDWMDNNWDMLDIYEVDLDKEYVDKETNRWTKR